MKEFQVLPIPDEGIKRNITNVDSWLLSLAFSPAGTKERVGTMSPQLQQLMSQYMNATGTASQNVSIFDNLKRFGEGSNILSTHAAKIANTVKYGFALGISVMEMYEKASGLANMRELNKNNQLGQSQIGEFQQRQMTGAAIMLFASAYYIVWELSRYRSEETADRVLPAPVQLPEFTIINASQSAKFGLFYYGKFIGSEQLVSDEVMLIKFTIEYFNAILNELNIFKSSLQYTEEFENANYKLDGTDFVVSGFNIELRDNVKSFEFKPTKWEEVVGNRDSKHANRRLIQSLLCYDTKTHRNPMLDLGGVRTVTMGYGPPGTGKSMLIAATATELAERCKDLKIPFLFWPFPPNPVSEYQGGSAERVLAWFRPLKDPNKIIYGPIDDAENNLVSRGSRSISSGNREVISIYLTETEGAGAVLHGNYAIQMFTNRPEDLDSAVLSRIQGRTTIAGAESWQDFTDQDYLWWKKYESYSKGFAGMKKPDDYEYFEHQKLVKSLNDLSMNKEKDMPKNEIVKDIYMKLSNQFDPEKDDKFYGLFYHQVKNVFKSFTSRDLRNIQMAVSERIMDFDLPEECWTDNDYFFAKDYEYKNGILVECMKENMKGLSFGRIRLQEGIRYIDNKVAIEETSFETAVKEQMESMKVHKTASERFLKLA